MPAFRHEIPDASPPPAPLRVIRARFDDAVSTVEKAMRIFVPVDCVPIDERAGDAAWLVPYRCGLPFALDVDAAETRRDENAQRLIVISSPGERPMARDCPALSSST